MVRNTRKRIPKSMPAESSKSTRSKSDVALEETWLVLSPAYMAAKITIAITPPIAPTAPSIILKASPPLSSRHYPFITLCLETPVFSAKNEFLHN